MMRLLNLVEEDEGESEDNDNSSTEDELTDEENEDHNRVSQIPINATVLERNTRRKSYWKKLLFCFFGQTEDRDNVIELTPSIKTSAEKPRKKEKSLVTSVTQTWIYIKSKRRPTATKEEHVSESDDSNYTVSETDSMSWSSGSSIPIFRLDGSTDNSTSENNSNDKESSKSDSSTNLKSEVSVDSDAPSNLSCLKRDCLGLPNLGQTCYMNSVLQSLLNLHPFVQVIQNISYSKSQFFRDFLKVVNSRSSNDTTGKETILCAFKSTIAEFNSEFDDDDQKDAHEFLTTLLERWKLLSKELEDGALQFGYQYTCPVESHIDFKMLGTRICKQCGRQSTVQEDAITLSLDPVHRSSVRQALKKYLEGGALQYNCECGGDESIQMWSFQTLPDVLILMLKRFSCDRYHNLKKLCYPINISKKLLIQAPNNQQITYNLVSIISHLGMRAECGHYICDSAHRESGRDVASNTWLTYDDIDVSEAKRSTICYRRRRTAYLLFYERQPCFL
ncbi:ubiquitin carboxyl-terminal hydrolase 37-like [Synchiropus splendidus]|uniref:ubiquitin carboxyl-terminal hydrolase 37-like n=1 Tax=Synchiropus splendidus TaxID=270530 RepID=UPI00237E0341|nr:ubiquitin carboxyl-terminal hydrolase 37-like [Synchiropus splendidus]